MEEMKKKREDVVRIAQEKAEQEQVERATKRREAEKFSIKQQMKVAMSEVSTACNVCNILYGINFMVLRLAWELYMWN